MKVEIRLVGVKEKEILRNLLEKYLYEFSQWDGHDVNALGLYGYDYLDEYWTAKNRWAFFIHADGKLAGFAMVNDYPEVDEETDYTLSEFFVLHKYRRCGVGSEAAKQIFARFKGRWRLMRHPANLASVYFWDRVVRENAKGDYRLVRAHEEAVYHDGTHGDVFFFCV